jgi:hypothetical protein
MITMAAEKNVRKKSFNATGSIIRCSFFLGVLLHFRCFRAQEKLNDSEQQEHSEMEKQEDQHRNEYGRVFALFKDSLQHGGSPGEGSRVMENQV